MHYKMCIVDKSQYASMYWLFKSKYASKKACRETISINFQPLIDDQLVDALYISITWSTCLMGQCQSGGVPVSQPCLYSTTAPHE